jgi:phospholipid-binding lipoprotein MlaA
MCFARFHQGLLRRLLLLLLLVPLAACAAAGANGPEAFEPTDPSDPNEALNREVFDFNLALDDAVILPIARAYRAAVPEFARVRIRRFLENLEEPRVLANNLLQGRLEDAGHTTLRFVFNSTAGLGGLFDVATGWGIARRSGDFGQTLYVWGIADSPYLVLPIAGPSTVRDTIGLIGDGFLNPLNWLIPLEANISRGVVAGIDLREQNIESLDALRRESLDFYARLRSVWRQRRAAELRSAIAGTAAPSEGLDVLQDPGAAAPAEPPASGGVQPLSSAALRRRSSAASRSGPPSRRIVANSARREASSLTVPVR